MKSISITHATANNLKNVSLRIPLGKLVVVVGKSGSGKSSLIYDVLFRASQGYKVEAKVGSLPRAFALSQKIKPEGKLSLGETNLKRLYASLKEIKKGDLLIVDEPCAGMAKEDRKEVLGLLRGLVSKGISVIVIEHQKDIIMQADEVIEFGPDSGAHGGRVIFQGSIARFKRALTPTSAYVFSDKAAVIDYDRQPSAKAASMRNKALVIRGINKNSIKNGTLRIPLGCLVCLTGRMGTGKSTLLSVAYGALYKGKDAWKYRQGFASVEGKTYVRRSYFVDQLPLSSAPTSTPATYLGVWDSIRDIYVHEAKGRKMALGKEHFSFNTLAWKNTKRQIGKVTYHGVTIFDLLQMTVDQAAKLFLDSPLIRRKLGFFQEVGLGYMTLGQRSGTLSGGEAQRVKLAKILSKKLGDRCLYVLDNPTRGLHLSDLPSLMKVFQKILDKNNTILIAENREEVVSNCDEVIRL